MTKNIQIGTPVQCNQTELNYAIDQVYRNVIPALKKILDQYYDLGLTEPFDNNLLLEVLNTGRVDKIETRCKALIEKRYENFPSEMRDMALASAPEKLEPIRNTFEELTKGINKIRPQYNSRYYFDYNHVVIEGRECYVNKKAIREQLQVVIESEEDIELFNEFTAFKKQFNRLAECMRKQGDIVSNADHLTILFDWEDDDNQLTFDARTVFEYFRRKRK